MEKLEKMVHDINADNSQSLNKVTDRVSEAEQRILAVETAAINTVQALLWKKILTNQLNGFRKQKLT